MVEFLSGSNIYVYLTIFILKITEVSMDTLRIVLISKGQKKIGAIIGFFVIIIWVFVVSSVLQDIQYDIMKVFVYALGYAIGNYMGVTIENKLAIGYCSMEVIVRKEKGEDLARELRDKGYGLTVIEGKGLNFDRHILLLHLDRKRVGAVKRIIKEEVPDGVITVNDISNISGGFISRVKPRR